MRCIRKNIKLYVSLIAIILIVIIFSTANMAYENLQNTINYTEDNIAQEAPKEQIIDLDEEIEKVLKENKKSIENWEVEIPVIGLVAPISEGTTQEVMREYVGHFENTRLWKGNIGLAAHNRRFSNKLF